jgi:hypothetical protein
MSSVSFKFSDQNLLCIPQLLPALDFVTSDASVLNKISPLPRGEHLVALELHKDSAIHS